MTATAQPVSDLLWQQVSALIERRTGLYFPRERFADLERGLGQAAREAKFRSLVAYIECLLSRGLNLADLEILAGSLTVGETHFLRDACASGFLESTLLPGLIAAKRGGVQQLRIWSAGCASGEEAYSLAILLHRLIPDLPDWQITILGTDINPKAIAKAANGIYSEWSFRDTPAWVKPQCFAARAGGRYEILPGLKRMVSFACLNLVDDVYPSVLNNTNAMDLIVCRNVLLYFKPESIAPVVERFHRSMACGGQLALGVVESGQMSFAGFTPVPASGLALYRQHDDPSAPAVNWFDQQSIAGTPARRTWGEAVAADAHATPVDAQPQTRHVLEELPASRAGDYVEARRLYDAGRYLEVRAILNAGTDQMCESHPQSAMLLAQCHANLGELAEALVWSERALAADATDPDSHFLRGVILQELQRDDEALLALRNVLFLHPDHLTAIFSMANLYRRRNQRALADRQLGNLRQLLANRDESEELPQSGGLTVGRLNAILTATEAMPNRKGPAHA